MAQQTPIEWLIDQMFKQGYFDGNKPLTYTNLDHLQNQATEMFKQKIEIAFEEGMNNSADYYIPHASGKEIIPECENYYKQTYGDNNKQ